MKRTLASLIAVIPLTLAAQSNAGTPHHRLHFRSNYGFFVANGGESGLPREIPSKDLKLKLIKPDDCYELPTTISVSVVDDEGNTTEQAFDVNSYGYATVPVDAMKGGNVYISAHFSKPAAFETDQYQLVFSDEFDEEDYSQPNSEKWERAPHNNNSAWNRYVSTSDKVVYVEDGDLVTRCIPCAPEDLAINENRDWMSGAVDTHGLYSFKYGRVDVRALTNPFAGSFPAIWMMPDDQSAGWPFCGEIDIWEMINTLPTAYGTVHAAKQSQKSGSTTCKYDGLYHVYTFEWTNEKMTWSIDGRMPYTAYEKKDLTTEQLNSGYWPFNKKFYLILNQSVGNGSWASNPVAGHEYETRFDFVRIYQTKKQNARVGIDDITAEAPNLPAATYDLFGRQIQQPAAHGVYIAGGKKMLK